MISKTDQNWLDTALSVAESSDCKHSLGAVVVSGGRFQAIGINRIRNVHPDFAAIHNDLVPQCWTYHAEQEAIRRTSPAALKRATLYVARRNNLGKPLLARPCSQCEGVIRKVGIAKVVYTTPSHPQIIKVRG